MDIIDGLVKKRRVRRAIFDTDINRADFVEYYLKTFDPIGAARVAGSKTKSVQNLRFVALRIMKEPEVIAAIDRAIELRAMGGAEVLDRLGEVARGTLGHFIQRDGVIDLTTEEAQAYLFLLKRVKTRTIQVKDKPPITETEIELRDPDKALELMAKHFGLLIDRNVNLNFDLSKLNSEQLARLAAGEPLAVILATASEGGIGSAPKEIGEGQVEEPADLSGGEPDDSDGRESGDSVGVSGGVYSGGDQDIQPPDE